MELYSDSVGEGPPILFIHGFGANTYSWNAFVGPLSKTHRVTCIDLKGFGRSPKPRDEAYSILEQSQLVVDYIRRHNLRDLTLVGHSFGGAVALVTVLELLGHGFAVKDKSPSTEISEVRPRKLVLIDSLAYSQKLPSFLRLLRIPWISQIALDWVPLRLQIKNTLGMCYHRSDRITREQIEAYVEPLKTPEGRYGIWQTAQQIEPENMDEIIARYPRIDLPTLILWGRQDRVIPLVLGERLHEALPESKLVVIEQCGHIPHEECPEESLDHLSKFVACEESS